GLVKVTENEAPITRHGIILGSPQFMAPEQIMGEPIDLRADIYAFGIMMYRALTGKYPFSAPDSRSVMESHLTRPPPTLVESAPDLVFPPALEHAVARCLKKSPDDRFIDMTELMASLQPILGDEHRTGFVSSGITSSPTTSSSMSASMSGSGSR